MRGRSVRRGQSVTGKPKRGEAAHSRAGRASSSRGHRGGGGGGGSPTVSGMMLVGRNPSAQAGYRPLAGRLQLAPAPPQAEPALATAPEPVQPAPAPAPEPEPEPEPTPRAPSPRVLLALRCGPGFLATAGPWAALGGRAGGVALRVGYCRLDQPWAVEPLSAHLHRHACNHTYARIHL